MRVTGSNGVTTFVGLAVVRHKDGNCTTQCLAYCLSVGLNSDNEIEVPS